MSNRATYIIAALMLILMFGLAFFSILDDSMTMDEVAHLPAGYSYVTQLDMRLNPEHPPLIKDMAGIGVWLWSKITNAQINFPYNIASWKDDINGQWDFGFKFMYESNNDADGMLLAGRLPMFLILLLLGIYIFKWAKELFGNQAALLALFLYSLSPTFIAHGRLVTTDVAAAAAIFIALYYFVRWLKLPTAENLIVAGIVFGVALCAKFSVFLLIPLFGFLTIIWLIVLFFHPGKIPFYHKGKQFNLFADNNVLGAVIGNINSIRKKIICSNIANYIVDFIFIGLLALLTIYTIYIPHVWNYPVERQVNDMNFILYSYAGSPDQIPFQSCANLHRIKRCPAEITIWMASKPILRPMAQYLYGLLMVIQRAAGGNTTYFLGEVSAAGWKSYFPIIYALKEPLTMHILTFVALLFAAYNLSHSLWKKPLIKLVAWIKNHIAEFAMLSFIALYWASSVNSPLNIGVRHILPTFPFIYILVSGQISKWLQIKRPDKISAVEQAIRTFFRVFGRALFKYAVIIMLLFWQFVSVIAIYPYFLTYFNEVIGDPQNGYVYATDSNLDWGQDLKRLAQWTEKQNIQEIYVDYFGGSSPKYYLGDKLNPWWGDRSPGELPPKSYLAISATLLQGGRGKPAPGYASPTGYYNWLNDYEPITVIGHSIFVYHIP